MQLSNYPPGVTGTELQIAGGADPIEEVRDGMYCAACETSWAISVVIEVAEFTQTVWWECPKCGAEHIFEEDLPDGAVRAARTAWLRDRERQYRRHTRGIPTDVQRAQWAAEFDRWANAIRAEAWAEGAAQGRSQAPLTNPYRED